MKGRALFYLVLFSLVLSLSAQSVLGTIWHVSTSGTDQSGCGTEANPCRTLTYLFPNYLSQAKPVAGDTVLIHEGTYTTEPGDHFYSFKGLPDAWLTISGANAYPQWSSEQKPVFSSGRTLIIQQLPVWDWYAQYFVLKNIVFQGSNSHGINIASGFEDELVQGVELDGLEIIGSGYACVKMGGIDNFVIRNITCRDSTHVNYPGIGLDCVGCHDGLVEDSRYINLGYRCDSSQCQTNDWRSSVFHLKGGSRNVTVRDNYVANAYAGAMVGQATGVDFFRPPVGSLDADGEIMNYEAKDINHYSNIFVNVSVPVTFSTSIRGKFIHNTIYNPINNGVDFGFNYAVLLKNYWQGTSINGVTMVSSYDGEIKNNIFVFGKPYGPEASHPLTVWCQDIYNNFGSFKFQNNLFYNLNNPSLSEPEWSYYTNFNCMGGLPTLSGNIAGQLPIWVATGSDFHLQSDSPAIGQGLDLTSEVPDDFDDVPYNIPPSIGAFEYGEVSCDSDSDCSFLDNLPCVEGFCDVDSICKQQFTTNACDDGNECTENDVCSAGICSGTNVADDTPCTSDGNECTLNVCVSGVCTATSAPDGTLCSEDDGIACTSNPECVGGECVPQSFNHALCTDRPECNVSTCTVNGCVYSECPLPSDLVLWLPFDGNMDDVSDNNNDGSCSNCPTLTTDKDGNANSAYLFGGNEQYITLTNEIAIDSDHTISLWFSADVLPASSWQQLIGKFDADNYISIYNGSMVFLQDDASADHYQNWVYAFSINEWYHLVIRRSGNDWEAFVNGQSLGIETFSTPLYIDTVGEAYSSGSYEWRGKIDDVRVYSRALNDAEIQDLYEGSPTTGICGDDNCNLGETCNACPQDCMVGDVNGNCNVDLSDLITVAGNFGCTGDCGDSDIDDNNIVNILDLILVGKNFT